MKLHYHHPLSHKRYKSKDAGNKDITHRIVDAAKHNNILDFSDFSDNISFYRIELLLNKLDDFIRYTQELLRDDFNKLANLLKFVIQKINYFLNDANSVTIANIMNKFGKIANSKSLFEKYIK